MAEDQSFLGIGWGFPPEFNKLDHTVQMVSKEQDIEESLRILLSTAPGERTMHPNYGCGIHEIVFETMDESMVTYTRELIRKAVLKYEPRITLNSVLVNVESALDGILYIQLNYTIRTTNSRANMVYPFYINEGSNIRLE